MSDDSVSPSINFNIDSETDTLGSDQSRVQTDDSKKDSLCEMCSLAPKQDPFKVRFTDKEGLRRGFYNAIEKGLIDPEHVEHFRIIMGNPCVILGQFVFERIAGMTQQTITEVAMRTKFTQEEVAQLIIEGFGKGENGDNVTYGEYCKFTDEERIELFYAVFNYHMPSIIQFIREQ
ncbi:hypothetical protein KC669_00385 [Candidatus Dojkabacteria bacterium]|uniref:Uncharacterized protein n=1 Tax=Candidatus Dojkabacteria bacterium TaxID=2099670 RepID=A0A955RL16_9BACT|nr:hypothetical protein [Candidatus Dojkabacteria bacterium]